MRETRVTWPSAVLSRLSDPLLHQGLDQFLHEKGVAFRPRQDELF